MDEVGESFSAFSELLVLGTARFVVWCWMSCLFFYHDIVHPNRCYRRSYVLSLSLTFWEFNHRMLLKPHSISPLLTKSALLRSAWTKSALLRSAWMTNLAVYKTNTTNWKVDLNSTCFRFCITVVDKKNLPTIPNMFVISTKSQKSKLRGIASS